MHWLMDQKEKDEVRGVGEHPVVRIFDGIQLVIRNVRQGKDVLSIASDGLGSFTEQEDAIGGRHIKLQSLDLAKQNRAMITKPLQGIQ